VAKLLPRQAVFVTPATTVSVGAVPTGTVFACMGVWSSPYTLMALGPAVIAGTPVEVSHQVAFAVGVYAAAMVAVPHVPRVPPKPPSLPRQHILYVKTYQVAAAAWRRWRAWRRCPRRWQLLSAKMWQCGRLQRRLGLRA